MESVISFFKRKKQRLIIAAVWAVFMVGVLAFFYYLKAQNDFFISSRTKIIVLLCMSVSTILILFRPKLPAWLSYILETLIIFASGYFLFTYLEPVVNDMVIVKKGAPNINIAIVTAVILFAFGLFQNAGFAVGIGGFFVYAIYIIDYFTISFRGTPFVLSDFFSAKTAMGVMGKYKFVLDERMLVGFYVLAIMASFGAFVSVKNKKLLQRIIPGLCGVVIGAGFILLITFTELITKNGYKTVAFIPLNSARENCLPLNIISSLKDSFIKVPEGYSAQAVSKIIEANSIDDDVNLESLTKPNIIVIMNESFTNFDYLLNVQTTEDPIPKFKAMYDNCVKGTLISSIYGGNTPNSEFEFLTGCSLAFLPQGIVTYQQLIDNELPNFVTQLEDLGYKTSAIHLYNPEFFSRSRIYPLLGFDEFININNVDFDPVYVNDYVSDASSFRAIEEVYEKSNGDPFFTFCVTIQNHGGYFHFGRDVLVTNANSDYANDYSSLIKKTDDAFADLIDYFSHVDDPTIIVMYGDHQPNLFNDFYDAIWSDYTFTDEEKTYLKSKVPFVIWANYDIEEEQYGEISINYFAPLVLKTAGLPLSGFQTYLDNLRNEIPVISGIGYVDADGNHFTDSQDSKYAETLRDYSYLQYYYLKKNAADDFFK